jgi:hypothetical protein
MPAVAGALDLRLPHAVGRAPGEMVVGAEAGNPGCGLSVLEQHCRNFDRPVSSLVVAHSAPVIIAESHERIEERLNAVPERFRAMGIIGTPEEVTKRTRTWSTWVSPILSLRYAGMISRRSNCWGLA